MGIGPLPTAPTAPNRRLQPSEYFLKALEAQRAINTHIHEIEPTTPIFLYEIDLNEIRPASISYPISSGPITNGVLRIHNDFNLFNINKGIIKWRGNNYFPFPVYGEQFDITSNGTIPTPKVKFSSQFLDDEFNSFYKYIRMQINDLKDIVGSKVTRVKTFVRYLHPDNFVGGVNPFNDFLDTPWASRDGEVLTVRTLERVPSDSSKWLIYNIKQTKLNNGIFTCTRTDDRLKTLDIQLQQNNFYIESYDFFNYITNEKISDNPDIDSFSSDVFIIPHASASYANIIPKATHDFRRKNSTETLKSISYYNTKTFTNQTTTSISYPFSHADTPDKLINFISLRADNEMINKNFNYSITNQTSSTFSANFSTPLSGTFYVNFFTISTGIYTGVNYFSNEDAQLLALKLTKDFGTDTSGEYNIVFPLSFQNVPKILFNSWGNSGFKYNQYLKNINSTGCTLVATHTGDNIGLYTQNINLIATDYITEDSTPVDSAQIYTSYQNNASNYLSQIGNTDIEVYEVELTPDIYYIDRKVQEDSQNVIYELASLLDIEGIKIPGRLLLSKNCPFTYRGEGCLYERQDRLTYAHSGVYGEVSSIIVAATNDGTDGIANTAISSQEKCLGLQSAPPVANLKDDTFYGASKSAGWEDKGSWQQNIYYVSNNYIFIEKNGIKYYFVCKLNHTSNSLNSPPNSTYWESDSCSKTLKGCRLRWKQNPNFTERTINFNYKMVLPDGQSINNTVLTLKSQSPIDSNGKPLVGVLPFGGYPSIEGKYQSQQGGMGGP